MENSQVKNAKIKIDHFKEKADHNKREALWSFRIIMLSTVAIPTLIAFGDDEFLSKLLPSCLSCLSAFLTAWIQLRKPNQLWKLYRTTQRQLESELELYQFSAGLYKNEKTRDTLIVERINEIYLSTNDGWSQLVPNKSDIKENSK